VTKSVYLGPDADRQLLYHKGEYMDSLRPSLKQSPGSPRRGTPPELA
jgi:hypothetical protein